MKKLLLTTSAICLLTSYMAFGQYTKLLDFAGTTNGSNPYYTNLMQASDGMLYGMTGYGGANNFGVLFQYNPSTSAYTDKLDFIGTTYGVIPYGSLMQASDGMLYGMTESGGANNFGVLFQYNPVTSVYTKKLDFAGATNGRYPTGTLMQASDGMLYGMTIQGGVSDSGVIFQYNPFTSVYTKKLDFAGTTNGSNPNGALIQASDGMLYGMTYEGGANNLGVLFQYNTSTSAYTKKLDFDATNGEYPYGSLMQAGDGMLYGMTRFGGANYMGVLFQYNPSTSAYVDKLDFAGVTNGANPVGDLMQASDGMLYGMTIQGGVNNDGILFQYNTATSTCTKKLDFDSINGSYPTGSLMQASDGMLYGMTYEGGTNNLGVMFKFGIATGIAEMTNDDLQMTIYPNPFAETATLQIADSQITNAGLTIYNVFGQVMRNEIIRNFPFVINRGDLADGIYFLRLKTEHGTAVKKLIINK